MSIARARGVSSAETPPRTTMLLSGRAACAQRRKMATVGSSGQSLSTLFSRYRSAPAGSGSKKLCPQRGPGPAADIDDGADRLPAAADVDVVVGNTMPGRSHQRVEAGRDPRVRGQVLPERPAEHLFVGRLAGADLVQHRAPGMGHPAAEAVQVVKPAGVRQLLSGPVAREPS